MKKLTVVFLLTIILCSILSFNLVAVAEGDNFYVANSDIKLYTVNKVNDAKEHTVTIPATYYLSINPSVDTNANIIPVKYNGFDFYIHKDDLSKIKKYDKAVENPYYAPSNFEFTKDTFDFYLTSFEDDIIKKNNIQDCKFIGFFTRDEINYYFVQLEYKTWDNPKFVYIAVSDTNQEVLLSTAPKHPNSITPTPDEPTITDPTNNPSEPATNDFVRNILIAVICALSLLVVFLIFKPSKPKHRN